MGQTLCHPPCLGNELPKASRNTEYVTEQLKIKQVPWNKSHTLVTYSSKLKKFSRQKSSSIMYFKQHAIFCIFLALGQNRCVFIRNKKAASWPPWIISKLWKGVHHIWCSCKKLWNPYKLFLRYCIRKINAWMDGRMDIAHFKIPNQFCDQILFVLWRQWY